MQRHNLNAKWNMNLSNMHRELFVGLDCIVGLINS